MAAALPDRTIVASDIAEGVLATARGEADRRGLKNLELHVGDFNRLQLEADDFEIVAMLGALHHVEALENFWDQCRRTLRSGGVVLAQEYVGPNRMQWTPAQIEAGDRVLRDLVPAQHKSHHERIVPVPIETIVELDPSEAVRSSEILPTCAAAGFVLQGYASAGCALLQPVLMYQTHTFDPRNWEHNHVLTDLFREEDRLMREGILKDDFAMFVAAPS